MTGREAIEQYMDQYGVFTCELVADAYGLKRSVTSGASHKMRQNSEIALDRQVWRTNSYAPVNQELSLPASLPLVMARIWMVMIARDYLLAIPINQRRRVISMVTRQERKAFML